MSSITGVSSYSKYLSLVRNLSGGQNDINRLSEQLTTGKKSVDLNAYGPEVQKLLDLRSEMAKKDNYVQSINMAAPRVQATDKVLTSLESIVSSWTSSTTIACLTDARLTPRLAARSRSAGSRSPASSPASVTYARSRSSTCSYRRDLTMGRSASDMGPGYPAKWLSH